MQLASLDLVVIAIYILGTTLLGAWFGRSQKDIKTYFVGDRNVGWFLVLISIVATETSTVTFLSVPGLAYRDGGNMTYLQLGLGYIAGRFLISWLLLPMYFKGECMSAYELLRQRFDVRVQRVASFVFLMTRTLADGLRLFLTALLLQEFTQWDMVWSIVAMGFITLLYTYLGGMQAVIWTDLIQFAIYIAGAVVAGGYMLDLLPGGLSQYREIGLAADKFRVFDFDFSLAKPFTFWAGLIGGCFISMASHGADQIMVQRYLCSKSLGSARLALLSSGFVVFVQFALFLLLGIGVYVLQTTGATSLDPKLGNDKIFGAFIVKYLPAGIVGLVVAAVLAAAMSTLSSSLNSSANATINDFYKPLRPGGTDRHYLLVSRLATMFWGVMQIGVALGAFAFNSGQSAVELVLSIAGLTTGVLLGLYFLASQTKRVSSSAAVAGFSVGAAAVGWLFTMNTLEVFKIAFPWYPLVGSTMTCLGAHAYAFLFPDKNTLTRVD